MRVLLLIALLCSGCTIQRYYFAVRPIDPPIQDEQDEQCIAFGYDGLACDTVMGI